MISTYKKYGALLTLIVVFFQGYAQLQKQHVMLGSRPVVYDSYGTILPWTTWSDALRKEMLWYQNCPVEQGYPKFIGITFMDGNYQADSNRRDIIPATQNGMGIISYLKYYVYTGRSNKEILDVARNMGTYLVKESNTPNEGSYPGFTRSTGIRGRFPQPADCGTQGDKPFEIQPDKGGIAGYALVLLYKETKNEKYLAQALHNASVLAKNMVNGDSLRSPWPFRADYRSGKGRGEISGNMVYILRLFNTLNDMGYHEFDGPEKKLWSWIRDYQLPDLHKDGKLWVQFFEDHDEDNNRTAWAPLNLARYLLEEKGKLDTAWRSHSKDLVEFVNKNFTSIRNGILICGEQDHDKDPWGGILSTYGAVLAMYVAATGSDEYKGLAWNALNFALYGINNDGCPCEQASYPCRGGWQEDAHTDKIHNYIDAMNAVREWQK